MAGETFGIVTGDFVKTGGMDRANYALASYLARNGHNVKLVSHRVDEELAALPYVSVQIVRKPLGSYFLGQWPISWAGVALSRTVQHMVVNGGNCCVPGINWVHYVHAAYRPKTSASWLRRLKGRVVHSLSIRAERTALRAARFVVCNSERTRRDVIELGGIEASKTVTVYYGTDPELFCPATDSDRRSLRERLGWDLSRPVVLFIGALGDRRKGFDTLFEAWTRLCKMEEWDAILVVVGSGAERPAWAARAANAGLAGRIEFLGFRSDVPDLLRSADAMVAPTRYEAYGLGVHEGLCCGLPAIVSASAGIAERYPPELSDMLLPDPNDAADLVTRLRLWRANTCLWRERVRPLSNCLRKYIWDDMSRQILQVCK